MPGLLDMMFNKSPLEGMGGMGGMLNFRDRWAPAQGAYANGTFDVQGANNMPPEILGGASRPPNAVPTVGQAPMSAPMSMAPAPAQAPPPSPDVTAPAPALNPSSPGGRVDAPSTSLLGRMGGTLGSFPQTLMKMGAGFAGAPNLGQGMSRAFAGGAEGLKDDQQKQAMGETYQALVKAGVPPAQAMAAITAQQGGNASLLSGLAAKHFGPQHLMNVGNQLRDPNSGALIAQGPPSIEKIQSGSPSIPDISVQRNAAGQLEVINPATLPQAGSAPVPVQRIEEALKLPPGTQFVDPFGMVRTR